MNPYAPIPAEPQVQPRPWARTRRLLIGAVFAVLLAGLGYGGYRAFIYTAPSCFDGVLNGDERGIDCGGSCARACVPDIAAPSVQWARAFQVGEGVYHAVAYVVNPNKTLGTASLRYTMVIEDAAGIITTRTGTTVFPPDGVYPVFEARIETGGRVPTSVRVAFDAATATWGPSPLGRADYTVLARELMDATTTAPRVRAVVQNNTYAEVNNVRVVAIVYDGSRNPLTASQTLIPRIAARERADAVFTWTAPVPGIIDTCTALDAATSTCGLTPTILDIIPVPDGTR